MTQVWFCSDLHFGHKNIQKFRGEFISSEEENRKQIKEDWINTVSKRDIVYCLGDACFTTETLQDFGELPGHKYLIRGNHDLLDNGAYAKYFNLLPGLFKYKEFWLSHHPIHPDELRGRVNLHGHVHYESIRKHFNPVYDIKQELDTRYFNCCCENLWKLKHRCLISLDEIREYYKMKNRTPLYTVLRYSKEGPYNPVLIDTYRTYEGAEARMEQYKQIFKGLPSLMFEIQTTYFYDE